MLKRARDGGPECAFSAALTRLADRRQAGLDSDQLAAIVSRSLIDANGPAGAACYAGEAAETTFGAVLDRVRSATGAPAANAVPSI